MIAVSSPVTCVQAEFSSTMSEGDIAHHAEQLESYDTGYKAPDDIPEVLRWKSCTLMLTVYAIGKLHGDEEVASACLFRHHGTCASL